MKQHHLWFIGVGIVGGILVSFFWHHRVASPAPAVPYTVQKSTSSATQTTSSADVFSFVEEPSFVPRSEIERANVSPYEQFARELVALKALDTTTIGLQFFGDIMLDRNVAKAMGASGTAYIFKNILGENKGLDPRIDITIANLEGPFAPTRVQTSKSIAFRFDPKYAAELKTAGFDAVSLANNHTLDMGWKNVDFTHQTLAAASLAYFGDQVREGKEFTLVTTTAGQSLALIGFNNTDHVLDLKKIAAILADARERASTTLVMMHWGTEYERISNANQRTFAHFLIDQGADAVIGAHPHVIEEAELYKGKPIFYSLGNFVFDQYFSTDTQEGLTVGFIMRGGKINTIYAIPLYSVRSQVFLMEKERRDDFYTWLNNHSRLDSLLFKEGRFELPH